MIRLSRDEAEVIKKNKLLEVKEKFLNKKADLEENRAIRNQKIQQAENKLKKDTKWCSTKRMKNYGSATTMKLKPSRKVSKMAGFVIIEKKKEEADELQSQKGELEALPDLSAEEADVW